MKTWQRNLDAIVDKHLATFEDATAFRRGVLARLRHLGITVYAFDLMVEGVSARSLLSGTSAPTEHRKQLILKELDRLEARREHTKAMAS